MQDITRTDSRLLLDVVPYACMQITPAEKQIRALEYLMIPSLIFGSKALYDDMQRICAIDFSRRCYFWQTRPTRLPKIEKDGTTPSWFVLDFAEEAVFKLSTIYLKSAHAYIYITSHHPCTFNIFIEHGLE